MSFQVIHCKVLLRMVPFKCYCQDLAHTRLAQSRVGAGQMDWFCAPKLMHFGVETDYSGPACGLLGDLWRLLKAGRVLKHQAVMEGVCDGIHGCGQSVNFNRAKDPWLLMFIIFLVTASCY